MNPPLTLETAGRRLLRGMRMSAVEAMSEQGFDDAEEDLDVLSARLGNEAISRVHPDGGLNAGLPEGKAVGEDPEEKLIAAGCGFKLGDEGKGGQSDAEGWIDDKTNGVKEYVGHERLRGGRWQTIKRIVRDRLGGMAMDSWWGQLLKLHAEQMPLVKIVRRTFICGTGLFQKWEIPDDVKEWVKSGGTFDDWLKFTKYFHNPYHPPPGFQQFPVMRWTRARVWDWKTSTCRRCGIPAKEGLELYNMFMPEYSSPFLLVWCTKCGFWDACYTVAGQAGMPLSMYQRVMALRKEFKESVWARNMAARNLRPREPGKGAGKVGPGGVG